MMINPDEIFRKIKHEIYRTCPTHNFELINRAYEYAKEKHSISPPRLTGEPYICHPARVALILAQEKMESEIIAAAFLHDVIEDCSVTKEMLTSTFGGTVAKIVDALSALDKKATSHLTKEERDNQSYYKFLSQLPKANLAIYVKLADRLDNLRTMGNMPSEKMLNKFQETEDFYLPLAEYLNIHLFISEIKDLIYKLRNPQCYSRVQTRYCELLEASAADSQRTRTLMEDMLYEHKKETGDLVNLQNRVYRFSFQKRNIASLARALKARGIYTSSQKSLQQFTKYSIPLFDIHLVMDHEDITPVDSFYLFYNHYLVNQGILINGFGRTTDGSQPYMLITDRTNIIYRLFLYTVDSYNYFMYGIDSGHDGEHATKLQDVLMNFNNVDPRKTYFPKITVTTRDGDRKSIEEGSTVLDFAFLVHTDLGLTMNYAIINGLKTTNLATRLHHGDHVVIVPVDKSEPVPARLEWFRWINTSHARHELYKWLNSGTIQITVLDVNKNQYFSLPKNSSVLDHLLLLDGSMEKTVYLIQHASEILVNDISYTVSDGLKVSLRHKERIKIECSDQISFVPDLQCFSYLNCREAREKMIHIIDGELFENQ